MNQSVKFTIITITYNAAQWLERTILSILSQSYGNIEYVIIDGASTDGTVDIIRQYFHTTGSRYSRWFVPAIAPHYK